MIIINLNYTLKDYKEYLEEDFPDSKFLKTYNNKTTSNVVSCSFKTLELLNLYMDHEKVHKEVKKVLTVLYNNILRFIYILPMGDTFFIMR